jgi:ABC-2 type transport system permease protein
MPLLIKELREMLGGRALWTMLLLLCPLVGWSFAEALRLYSEASAAARDSPIVASGLSPLDGILVPTFGSFYVAVTLLFPFVAIRALGHEKETGALRLLLQLPYRLPTLIGMKLAAVAAAWVIAGALTGGSALLIWLLLGGHLGGAELANLLLGHLLYGLLIGAIALFAASISDSAATAAIIALAFTIGSWVLDFTTAGSSGLAGWLAHVSLTPALRTFETGLLSAGLIAGMVVTIFGFCTLAAIWLPSGLRARTKLLRSAVCVAAAAILLGGAANLRTTLDVTEDKRNSFPLADQRALSELREALLITVHLSPEDPRYVDLRRNVLAKLERVVPNVTVRFAEGLFSLRASANDERYGEVVYVYGQRSDTSRSTSHREILPLIYALADVPPPQPVAGGDYPGYPLSAPAEPALTWFFGGLPLLIALCWWWCRRPPDIRILSKMENAHAHV